MLKPQLVSIIIPTFNRSHLIKETLDSVLAQTYPNWECIIVDDGSTDNTDEVLAAYCKKDSRFKYHHRPKDRPKGANACRNYGFELSKGDYLQFLDSDDLLYKDKLFIQIGQLHESSYDYTICQSMMYNTITKKETGLRSKKLISNNIFEDFILFKAFWLIEAPLWKSNFLKINHLYFDERLQQAQDYDFHIRVLAVSMNYFPYEKPLVLVKAHNDNMSLSTKDSSVKVYSNILIRYKILHKYSFKLSIETINMIYKELINYYKTTLREREYRLAFFCYKSLLTNLNLLQISFIKKIFFIFQISTSLLSFVFFKKGEKFLKFKNI